MKTLSLSLLALIFSITAFGQQSATISGTVTSADTHTPLVGVTVVVKGTTKGTSTNTAGKYSITAGQSGVLVFSNVGFTQKEEVIGSRSELMLFWKLPQRT